MRRVLDILTTNAISGGLRQICTAASQHTKVRHARLAKAGDHNQSIAQRVEVKSQRFAQPQQCRGGAKQQYSRPYESGNSMTAHHPRLAHENIARFHRLILVA